MERAAYLIEQINLPELLAFVPHAQPAEFRANARVIGRIAGQIISLIYGLLKQDVGRLAKTPPGVAPPEPIRYDPAKHQQHREGQYQPTKPKRKAGALTQLPKPTRLKVL